MPIELTPGAAAAPYDPQTDRQEIRERLEHSQEIEDLTAQIDVHDMTTILVFGSDAADSISKASDNVLKAVNRGGADDSGTMLNALAEIMKRFDERDFEEKSTLLGRLFPDPKKQTDKVAEKYTKLGEELDRVYMRLKGYETQLVRESEQLTGMLESNIGYFRDLQKYIVAGEQGCREIRDYIAELETAQKRTGDPEIGFELGTVRQALDLLEKRTQDLKTAEIVALQSIPMLEMTRDNCLNLARQIDSAFIITLPVFRQALAQAILMKRQRLRSEAMHALNRRTDDLLKQNARDAARMARQSERQSEKDDARLSDARRKILEGIGEARKLSGDAQRQKDRDREKLEAIRRDFEALRE